MNEGRKEVIQIVFIVIGIVFLVKLFFIQVVDSRYKDLADSNSILPQVDYPSRGLIYDRNHQLIAYNNPEFDVEVILQDVKKFDSVRFCEVFQMSVPELRKAFADMKLRKRIFTLQTHGVSRSTFVSRVCSCIGPHGRVSRILYCSAYRQSLFNRIAGECTRLRKARSARTS